MGDRIAGLLTLNMKTLQNIIEIINANRANGRFLYEGLESSEIGQYNRRLMFGENDEAFPDSETWSEIVD